MNRTARLIRPGDPTRALFRDLPSGDPRWKDRCAPLLAFIRAALRSHEDVLTWSRRTGFGRCEVEHQLSWLSCRGLIGGGARGGWFAYEPR